MSSETNSRVVVMSLAEVSGETEIVSGLLVGAALPLDGVTLSQDGTVRSFHFTLPTFEAIAAPNVAGPPRVPRHSRC